LDHSDAVIRVALGHAQGLYARGEVLGDTEACGVIGGLINT
jgi:hypothetical protein